jgi:hypothetical protein
MRSMAEGLLGAETSALSVALRAPPPPYRYALG